MASIVEDVVPTTSKQFLDAVVSCILGMHDIELGADALAIKPVTNRGLEKLDLIVDLVSR